MFENREDAARRLAEHFSAVALREPLVLGIPRGGVVVAAGVARARGAELDVVLARKLRAPAESGLAIGALSEDGDPYLNEFATEIPGVTTEYLARERQRQFAELKRRRALYRTVRPPAEAAGRSVIVVDEGIATGSTMLAALHFLKARRPFELIVATPVARPAALVRLARHCSRIECLLAPPRLEAIGALYTDFRPIDDDEVLRLLRESMTPERRG